MPKLKYLLLGSTRISDNANVLFELPSLDIRLIGFEAFEKLLEFGSFHGVYENPIVGSSSSQALLGTDGADLIVGYGGNDTLLGDSSQVAGTGGDDIFVGGSGNDTFEGGVGDDVFLFAGTGNGYDQFDGGEGHDRAIAVEDGTVIGVNGYANGVEEFLGTGDTIIRDTSSSHTLDFSQTILIGIREVDAGGGNDVVIASDFSSGRYRGGSGLDRFAVTSNPAAAAVDIAILDFDDGVDRIDLTEFLLDGDTLFDTLTIFEDGDDTVIELPGQNKTLRLIDFAIGDLDQDDFLL